MGQNLPKITLISNKTNSPAPEWHRTINNADIVKISFACLSRPVF